MSLKHYILFDPVTGTELKGTAVGQPSMLAEAPQGCLWVPVPSTSEWTVSMVEGVPTPTERGGMGDRPLVTAKYAARNRIKDARDHKEFSMFTWDGSLFDCDEKSQARIQGAFQLANLSVALGQPYAVEWTLADNSSRTLSALDMLGVGQALAAHILSCHTTARTLKQQIDAATTIEEATAIQWPQ